MTWFKVDDGLGTHPKARAAGLPAMGLWVVSGSWSAQHLTDGVVPEWFVSSWRAARYAERLESAGLWEPGPEGWVVHDFLDFNPSREQVLAERAANAERQQRFRAARRNGVTHSAVTGAPTRPDPMNP